MSTETTMVGALNQALRDAMTEDDRVLVLGEDVGPLGGVFRVTDELQAEFGEDRVFDTPWPRPASPVSRSVWPWPGGSR